MTMTTTSTPRPRLARHVDTSAPPVGTWAKIASLENLELLGHAGFDFAVIDTEHALLNRESIYAMTAVGQACGLRMLIRVPDGRDPVVQSLLDCGLDGLLIPRVEDVATAKAVVDGLRFPPHGNRGMGITSRAGLWGQRGTEAYLAGGAEVDLILQLESIPALRQAADFAAVDGVTGLFVGLGDLGLSSGLKPSDPEFKQALATAVEAAHEAGLPIGTAVGNAAGAERLREVGFDFFMVSNDGAMFARAATETASSFRTVFEGA